MIVAMVALTAGNWPIAPQPDVPAPPEKTELVSELKSVARQFEYSILVGPTVFGTSQNIPHRPPLEATLEQLLAGTEYEYRIVETDGGKLIAVGERVWLERRPWQSMASRCFDMTGHLRMEYLLEHKDASELLESLRGKYPKVDFTPHPSMNGFYASGGKIDLLEIKHELEVADLPEPPTICLEEAPENKVSSFLEAEYWSETNETDG